MLDMSVIITAVISIVGTLAAAIAVLYRTGDKRAEAMQDLLQGMLKAEREARLRESAAWLAQLDKRDAMTDRQTDALKMLTDEIRRGATRVK